MPVETAKWKVEVNGRETIENKDYVQVGNKEVKVYGTAYLDYRVIVEIELPKSYTPNKKFYGKIVFAELKNYHASYKPANTYKIKKIYASANFVNFIKGRSIIGFMPDPGKLRLNWPMPFDFKEPAVIVVTEDKNKKGEEKEACFSSDRFFDYISSYELNLKNNSKENYTHSYDGSTIRARVDYQVKLILVSNSS